jgi:biopolymer transport protein ExbB
MPGRLEPPEGTRFMFEGKSVLDIVNMGGFTMYILLVCSVISLTIILERVVHFRRKRVDRAEFMGRIRDEVEKGAFDVAITVCAMQDKPVANVVEAGLKRHARSPEEVSQAMEREILAETARLEQFTGVVGVIGSTAVYIGLFGTVLGIVSAFHNISATGSGGLPVVISGVAEALICTATGLLVAVPAVMAHNYLNRRVDRFVVDMEYCSSETKELLLGRSGADAVKNAAK